MSAKIRTILTSKNIALKSYPRPASSIGIAKRLIHAQPEMKRA